MDILTNSAGLHCFLSSRAPLPRLLHIIESSPPYVLKINALKIEVMDVD